MYARNSHAPRHYTFWNSQKKEQNNQLTSFRKQVLHTRAPTQHSLHMALQKLPKYISHQTYVHVRTMYINVPASTNNSYVYASAILPPPPSVTGSMSQSQGS